MSITIGDIFVWIIVGGFAGSVASAIVKRKKAGYGRLKNFGIGMAGAIIGWVLFKIFNIDFGLGDIAITFDDLLSALIGSFLLLLIIWIIQKRRTKNKTPLG
jgi:uncharacterized membrane protein YeaQ/YmgE (transglycosylase-associated protein family)